MGETIQLTAEDGHTLGAYRADPSGAPKGAVVVMQEIFGVNQHIRAVCDGYAKEGFVAIAPAVFDRVEKNVELGYDEDGFGKGRSIVGDLGWDGPLKDVDAARKAVASAGTVVGVGYCWGGTLAWLSATRLAIPSVGYYGGRTAAMKEETPKAPVMLHFGEHDHAIPMSDVEAIGKLHPYVPIHVYDAGHGFNCDERDSWDEPSAKLALKRTLAFYDAVI
jgi:carboxymethylenebutenolidase